MRRVAWELLPAQHAIHVAPEPYRALVTGVGGGKTHYGSRWLLMRAKRFPQSDHLATGNTYRQCLDVVVPAIQSAASEWGIDLAFLKSDMELRGFGVGLIRVRSLDKPDTVVRGPEYGSWWGDEVRDTTPMAADLAFGRLRCPNVDRPEYLWTTTPNGFDHIYDRHVTLRAKQLRERGRSDYALVQGRSRDNKHVRAGYFDGLEDSYDPMFAQQEIEGKFVAIGVGRAFYNFDRDLDVAEVLHIPDAIAYLGVDFGTVHSAVTVYQRTAAKEWIVLDEAQADTAPECIRILAEAGWTAHAGGWAIEPDPAGRAKNQTGHTDHSLVKSAAIDLGFRDIHMFPLSAAPSVRDKVNTVNALLCSSKGTRRLKVHSRCSALIRDLEQVSWTKGGDLDKGPKSNLTHVVDSLSYGLYRNARPDGFARRVYIGGGRYVDAV